MSASQHNMDAERLKRMYADMWRIRAFEEAAVKAQVDGLVGGAVHASIGQEAIAVGVCANLARTDQILTTHRNHGHCIAKGTDPGKMMLELFGKEGGTSGGKGGSMHIADFSVGMLGANGVVGAGLAQHRRERAAPEHGANIQTVAQFTQAYGVGIDNGDVIGLTAKLGSQAATDLPCSEDDDLHKTGVPLSAAV